MQHSPTACHLQLFPLFCDFQNCRLVSLGNCQAATLDFADSRLPRCAGKAPGKLCSGSGKALACLIGSGVVWDDSRACPETHLNASRTKSANALVWIWKAPRSSAKGYSGGPGLLQGTWCYWDSAVGLEGSSAELCGALESSRGLDCPQISSGKAVGKA